MKSGILARAFLTGTIYPLVIFLIAGVIDYITNESNVMFTVMLVEGIILLVLPVLFLSKEEKLNSEYYTKLTAPMYLTGYGVITLFVGIAINTMDMGKLFPTQFLGGIGLFMVWIVMAGGFVWAVLFRVGALVAKCISSAKEKKN